MRPRPVRGRPAPRTAAWPVWISALVLSANPTACVGIAAVVLGPCAGLSDADKEETERVQRKLRAHDQIDAATQQCGACKAPLACYALATPPACRPPLTLGERCTHPDDDQQSPAWRMPCAAPLRCGPSGECQKGAAGEPCYTSDDCAPGIACQTAYGTTGTCGGR